MALGWLALCAVRVVFGAVQGGLRIHLMNSYRASSGHV